MSLSTDLSATHGPWGVSFTQKPSFTIPSSIWRQLWSIRRHAWSRPRHSYMVPGQDILWSSSRHFINQHSMIHVKRFHVPFQDKLCSIRRHSASYVCSRPRHLGSQGCYRASIMKVEYLTESSQWGKSKNEMIKTLGHLCDIAWQN